MGPKSEILGQKSHLTEGFEKSLLAEAKKQPLEPPVKDAISRYENDRKAAQ